MSEAIERLKNRQRKKVSARNASLNEPKKSNVINENNQAIKQSSRDNSIDENSQELNSSDKNDLMTESSHLRNQSSNNDFNITTTQGVNTKVEHKRRTVRLDPEVDEIMDKLCKENRVTRETLIEAAMINMVKNQRTYVKVITEAKERSKNRQIVGELKKLETMNRKFGIEKL